uniref:DnaJ homolog subfamily C member 9 n=1 Tax=Falco tinnunculus TaxID=100819 RepID=A0A8C4TYM1_FALTI
MGLLEECRAAFGSADLYGVLGARRQASGRELSRAYRRASLRVHPDRAQPGDKEEATRRFQVLGKAYAVLSDEAQRALYDEQGTVDEEGEALRGERDWHEYWRLLFNKVGPGTGRAQPAASALWPCPPCQLRGRCCRGTGGCVPSLHPGKSSGSSVSSLLQITVKDIEDFEKSYKHSEEELADIKAAYVDFEGDMDRIMESVLCVDYTDEPRIRKIIQEAIDSGEVPSYKCFLEESKQKTMARKRRVGYINQGPKGSAICDKPLIFLGRNKHSCSRDKCLPQDCWVTDLALRILDFHIYHLCSPLPPPPPCNCCERLLKRVVIGCCLLFFHFIIIHNGLIVLHGAAFIYKAMSCCIEEGYMVEIYYACLLASLK